MYTVLDKKYKKINKLKVLKYQQSNKVNKKYTMKLNYVTWNIFQFHWAVYFLGFYYFVDFMFLNPNAKKKSSVNLK